MRKMIFCLDCFLILVLLCNHLVESDSCNHQAGKDSRMTLLLAGRIGVGKSATGNSILKKNVFRTGASTTVVTKNPQVENGCVLGQDVKVIDMPGIQFVEDENTENQNSVFHDSIKAVVSESFYGIDAFLYVLRYDTLALEEQNVMSQLKAFYGQGVFEKRGILVLTFGDNYDAVENDGMTFPEWLASQGNLYRKIKEECGDRVVLFDNKAKDITTQDKQLTELFGLVNHIKATSGSYGLSAFLIATSRYNHGIWYLENDALWHTRRIFRQLKTFKTDFEKISDLMLFEKYISSVVMTARMSILDEFFLQKNAHSTYEDLTDLWEMEETQLRDDESEVEDTVEEDEFELEDTEEEEECEIEDIVDEEETETLTRNVNSDKFGDVNSTPTEQDTETADNNHITLLLTGNAGKSAIGNSILGRTVFDSKSVTPSVRDDNQIEYSYVEGQVVSIINAPGLGAIGDVKALLEATLWVDIARPDGIDAIIVVLKYGSVSDGDRWIFDFMKRIYKADVFKTHGIVVLAHEGKEDIAENKVSGLYKEFTEECSNRVVLFDIKSQNQTLQEHQIKTLFGFVHKIKASSGRYTSILSEASRVWHDDVLKRSKVSLAAVEEKLQTIRFMLDNLKTIDPDQPEKALTILKQFAKGVEKLKRDVQAEKFKTGELGNTMTTIEKSVHEKIVNVKKVFEIKSKKDRADKRETAELQKDIDKYKKKISDTRAEENSYGKSMKYFKDWIDVGSRDLLLVALNYVSLQRVQQKETATVEFTSARPRKLKL